MRGKFSMPRIDRGVKLYIAITLAVLLVSSLAAYIIAGVMISADLPIVRRFKEPEMVLPASTQAYSIALSWDSPMVHRPLPYLTMFDDGETEDEFYLRMSDLDRRSLYQLTQKYPELLYEGLSHIKFDGTLDNPSEFLDGDMNEELRADLLNGAVKTKHGHTVLALDGTRSLMLITLDINDTEAYIALSYDKRKLDLSVTNTAFAGWWGTVVDHIKQNTDAVVAIPANNYTFNARAGYGVVDGGFANSSVTRYLMSGNYGLYMGFGRDGTFVVGDRARFTTTNFTEGLGVLLANGEAPKQEIVSALEQAQILEALEAHIKASEGNPEDSDYEALPVIKSFIESFDSNFLRAKTAWVISNQAISEVTDKRLLPSTVVDIVSYVAELEDGSGAVRELREAAELVALCREFGSEQYAQVVTPVRSAYNAIGQRSRDGATVLFGVGGAKGYESILLPGNGATVDDIRQVMLMYGITEAALTTSGDRVGFGWKTQNLLRVQDTPRAGGNAYGAYILR